MQNGNVFRYALIGGLLAMTVSACAPTRIGKNYGEAYYSMLEGQILNPEAGKNLEPVVEMDGQSVGIAEKMYQESFKKTDTGFTKSVVTSGVKTN